MKVIFKAIFNLAVIISATIIAVIWFMFYLFIAPILILIQLVKDNKRVKENALLEKQNLELKK